MKKLCIEGSNIYQNPTTRGIIKFYFSRLLLHYVKKYHESFWSWLFRKIFDYPQEGITIAFISAFAKKVYFYKYIFEAI